MQRFYHHELQQYEALMQALNAVLEQYNNRDGNLLPSLADWLRKAAAVYHKLGRSDHENRVLGWQAELNTATRNINPITLEKVSLHRHQMQSSIAFKVLQAAAAQVQADYQTCTQNLEEARLLAGQILTTALQLGLVTDEAVQEADTQEKLMALWKKMSADANVALGQKKLLLLVSRFDVWILLEAVAAAIAEPV